MYPHAPKRDDGAYDPSGPGHADLSITTRIIMLIGEVFLEAMSTGIITQEEIDWLTTNQSGFSREEEAMALKIGRHLDDGSIQIGCRLLGERAAS